MMSDFWGYASADTIAIIIISGLSLACLICARLFIQNHE